MINFPENFPDLYPPFNYFPEFLREMFPPLDPFPEFLREMFPELELEENANQKVTKRHLVPAFMLDRVVGVRSEIIREVNEISGAKTRIVKRKKQPADPNFKVIYVTGI